MFQAKGDKNEIELWVRKETPIIHIPHYKSIQRIYNTNAETLAHTFTITFNFMRQSSLLAWIQIQDAKVWNRFRFLSLWPNQTESRTTNISAHLNRRWVFYLTSARWFGRLGSCKNNNYKNPGHCLVSHKPDPCITVLQHFLNWTPTDWAAGYLVPGFHSV